MLTLKEKRLFASLVSKHEHFIVSGHQNADGDVIGSTLAVVLGLKALGKKVIAYNQDGCPPSLRFLPKSGTVVNAIPKNFKGVLITVDSGNIERLGPAINAFPFLEIWNVDHHKSNTRFGNWNFIDVEAASTGQVVLELLESLKGFELTPEIADNIFCTLSTDTGSFKYVSANARVFRLAARLIDSGARHDQISQALYDTYPARRLALLGRVLPTLKFEKKGRVAKIFMTREDVIATGAAEDDAEDFVNFPRGVAGVKIVCFCREVSENLWRVSLRARGRDSEVLSIARHFGGGGHQAAAGCTIKGTRAQIEAQLNSVIGGAKPKHVRDERRTSN